MLRLAHLSDIHLFAPTARYRLSDWFNKRLTGWLNLRLLPRGQRFRHAADLLKLLMDDVHRQRPDLIVFTGDATSLGMEEEFAQAAELLEAGKPDAIPGVAVPGNHDYYTVPAAASGLFERYFSPWLLGDRLDDAIYPFRRRLAAADRQPGDGMAAASTAGIPQSDAVEFIAVNSSTGNRWWWDATGSVGVEQRRRLERMLAQPALGTRILVTHYPVALSDGRPESRVHGLKDLRETLAVCRAGGIALWLHGHRHHPYHLPPTPAAPFHCLCAGSATQAGAWTYSLYTLAGGRFLVERRRFQPQFAQYDTAERLELVLGSGAPAQLPLPAAASASSSTSS
jgi:3',5'-cyclic AMP phosphodiesterase CpdA